MTITDDIMVVQFIIDWNHLVGLIFDGAGNDAGVREYSRLKLVEVELRRIKENISCNGILPRGKRPEWLKDLNCLIRRLRATLDAIGDMGIRGVVENLSLLLEAMRDQVYVDRGCVFETGVANSLGDRIDQVKRFLSREGFDHRERRIKTAVVTSETCNDTDDLWQYTGLDDYSGSKFEQMRQKWERNISFVNGQENDFLEYLSGVALAAIAFNPHEIEFYDPHWSSNVLRQYPNPRWNAVTKFYIWFFCGFRKIVKVTFVSEEKSNGQGCTEDVLHFELFRKVISDVVKNNRPSGVKFEIGVRIRRRQESRDFHNRYLFTGSVDSDGSLGCLMPDGIDWVQIRKKDERTQEERTVISRTFECCLWNMNFSAEWKHIREKKLYFERSCISLADGDFIPVSQERCEIANFPYRGGVAG